MPRLVTENVRNFQKDARESIMASRVLRGLFSASSSKVFLTTFSQRSGIQYHASFVLI